MHWTTDLKYDTQKLIELKGEENQSTVTVVAFNTLLSTADRTTRQKPVRLHCQPSGWIDVYRKPHSKTAEYTFLSSIHGTLSKRDHILSHQTNLSVFKSIEIVRRAQSEHMGLRLQIRTGKVTGNSPNIWYLRNTTLNNPWVKGVSGKF